MIILYFQRRIGMEGLISGVITGHKRKVGELYISGRSHKMRWAINDLRLVNMQGKRCTERYPGRWCLAVYRKGERIVIRGTVRTLPIGTPQVLTLIPERCICILYIFNSTCTLSRGAWWLYILPEMRGTGMWHGHYRIMSLIGFLICWY